MTLLVFSIPLVHASAAPERTFPDRIPLPNGFQPEGIAIGRGPNFYVGSIPTGAIYHGDLRTGEGSILVPGGEGRVAIGLYLDQRTNYLFVAGGPTGMGYIYDAGTGNLLAEFQFTTADSTFINDVVVTEEAAYFTDSFNPYIYRVPLGPGGKLLDNPDVQALELTGEWMQAPEGFNANGIDATPNGKTLIVVNSVTGNLYWVDPQSGEATLIDLGGDTVVNGDGILLDGHTLYVAQNQDNQVAVVELTPQYQAGMIVRTIESADFDIPTTIAEFGDYLYVVNARFNTPPGPDVEYWVTRVPKH
jgi:sugar lactone lactonase YvrE